MTIIIFVLIGDLNGKIVVVRFFVGYIRIITDRSKSCHGESQCWPLSVRQTYKKNSYELKSDIHFFGQTNPYFHLIEVNCCSRIFNKINYDKDDQKPL